MTGRERIRRRFDALGSAGRAGLVAFITAGDPDRAASAELLSALPSAGADIIELGMPFSDPMADGPAVQASSERALAGGMTLAGTLQMVSTFRQSDGETPIILMGYFNPIYAFGCKKFADAAAKAGVDGLIVVDLPPEEDAELREPLDQAGLALIRLATPTSDEARIRRIVEGASGFLYFVAIAGITGTQSGDPAVLERSVAEVKRATNLPVAVGFGVRNADQAAAIGAFADGVVVGSAIVAHFANGGGPAVREKALDFVRQLAEALRTGRPDGAAIQSGE